MKKGGKRKHSSGGVHSEGKKKRTSSCSFAEGNHPEDDNSGDTSSSKLAESGSRNTTKDTSCSQDTERSEGELSVSTQETQDTGNGPKPAPEREHTEASTKTKDAVDEEDGKEEKSTPEKKLQDDAGSMAKKGENSTPEEKLQDDADSMAKKGDNTTPEKKLQDDADSVAKKGENSTPEKKLQDDADSMAKKGENSTPEEKLQDDADSMAKKGDNTTPEKKLQDDADSVAKKGDNSTPEKKPQDDADSMAKSVVDAEDDADEEDKKRESSDLMKTLQDGADSMANSKVDIGTSVSEIQPIEDPISSKNTESTSQTNTHLISITKGSTKFEGGICNPEEQENTKEAATEISNTDVGVSGIWGENMVTAEKANFHGQNGDDGTTEETALETTGTERDEANRELSKSVTEVTSAIDGNKGPEGKHSEIGLEEQEENKQKEFTEDTEKGGCKEDNTATIEENVSMTLQPKPDTPSLDEDSADRNTVAGTEEEDIRQALDEKPLRSVIVSDPVSADVSSPVKATSSCSGNASQAESLENHLAPQPTKQNNATVDSTECPANFKMLAGEEPVGLEKKERNRTDPHTMSNDKMEAPVHTNMEVVDSDQCFEQGEEELTDPHDTIAEDSAFLDESAFEMDVTESQLCAFSDDLIQAEEEQRLEEARRKEQEEADKIVNDVLQSLLRLNNMVSKTRQEMEAVRRRQEKLTGPFSRR